MVLVIYILGTLFESCHCLRKKKQEKKISNLTNELDKLNSQQFLVKGDWRRYN